MKRLLRLPEVLERVTVSKSTIYFWIKNGNFPKPVHLGSISAWCEDEINTWIQEKISQRSTKI